MSTKVEQASTVEPHRVQTIITANTSAASASSPKISMFAAKSGFVIPKNKLSGSLVPIFRGGKKPGGSDAVNEESTKQVQRKTKWGPDLTQDAAVRKGRAVAYQTRVDQITKRLNSGILEARDNQDSPLSAPIPNHESSVQIKSEKSESLELERREAIGEILKLSPSYKAPKDYKPLLKEAKVSVPIKEYPGYNFIGLIFGPASDTQKRLEKETGAKVRVYGTKADTGEKGEITPSDGNEALVAYAELYVHISADTYEKVDAAVSLIELLVTPVSVNPSAVSTTSTSVSGDNVNAVDQSQGTSTPYIISPVEMNQKAAQSFMGSVQTPQVQFQPYPGPWFPAGPPQSPMRLPSGFIFPPNPSAPILNNLFQASSSSSFNPSHMPSLFGPRPVLPAGSVPQNPSLVPSRAQPPVLQHPFMPQTPFGHAGSPRNPPMPVSQPSPAQPSISAPPPPPHTGNQPPSIVRSLGPSLSQPVSTRPLSGSLPDRMLPPAGSSTQWSQALSATPPSLRPGSMSQMAPPVVPQGPHPVTPQPIIASGPPLYNITAVNMVSPVAFPPRRPSGPEPYSTSGNRPLVFTSGPQPPQARFPPTSSSFGPNQLSAPMSAPRPIQSPSPVASMQLIIARGGPVMPNPIPNPSLGGSMQVASTSTSTPPPPPQAGIPSSALGSAPTFTPIKRPSLTAPKPQHPNSSDFTFQPHRPQNLITQAVPRPGIQPTIQNMRPPNPTAQPPMAPQTPSFRPAIQTSSPPVMQGIPGPPLNNQMNQTHSQVSSFAGNPTITTAPPRHPSFPNPNPVAPSSLVPQMGHRKLNPAPHVGNMGGGPGPFPPRPGNPVQQQLQQNYLSAVGRPQSHLAPNQQQLGSNLPSASSSGRPAAASSSPGAQQNYDPFSPTSISTAPLQRISSPARSPNHSEKPPSKVSKGRKDLTLCRVFRKKTCCDVAQTHPALLSIRRLALTGEASQECLQLWELLECSICDPHVGVLPGPPLMCASLCDRVYKACSNAYFSMDAMTQVLVPCGVGDFVCGRASEWTAKPTELCRAAGFAVKPSYDHDMEETSCYGGKASLDSVADSWQTSRFGVPQKTERSGVWEDFQQWAREMPFIERVCWAVGGMVLTAGLLFASKRKSNSQRQKQAAIQRAARKLESKTSPKSPVTRGNRKGGGR